MRIFVFATLVLLGVSADNSEVCQYKSDISFLIDSSKTISNSSFALVKDFVKRIASRFGISGDGTHASAVIFSSEEETGVYLKLTDKLTTRGFQEAIDKAPHHYGRTRIDLAFKHAETIFMESNGARPNVRKTIFLLTDGKQHPARYDPVEASKLLHSQGVGIYVIGVGNYLDRDQLTRIAREESHVSYAKTFDDLVKGNFIKSVSAKACVPLVPTTDPSKCTEAPKSKCCGVGACSDCCGSRDVYSNIFSGNSGSFYVMNGMRLQQAPNGGKIDGVIFRQNLRSTNIDGKSQVDLAKLGEIVKNALSGKPQAAFSDLLQTLKSSIPKQRKRRSITGIKELRGLGNIAKAAGCNMFFDALKRHNLIRNVTEMLEANKKVALFCPINSAFGDNNDNNSARESEILMNHVGVRHDLYGTMYRTLSGGKVAFNPVGDVLTDFSWKANDVDVLFTVKTGTNFDVVVVKDVIFPGSPLLDVLEKLKNVNIFRRMLLSTSMTDVFASTEITSICFGDNMCVPISAALQAHLKKAIDFNQFTIIAPVDAVFEGMPPAQLKSLMNDPTRTREFLQDRVFLGSLSDHGYGFKEVADSISPSHSLMTMNVKDGNIIITDSANHLFKVKQSTRVAEGMLHIIDRIR